MRVFITGASGLIGKVTTRELLNAGHSVLALARSAEAAEELTSMGADVKRGSLYDLDILKDGAASSDGVIHLAFVHDFANFEKSCQTDRQAIQAMADALAGSSRPLITTTGTLLLPHGRLATEDDESEAKLAMLAERGRSETLTKDLASQGVRTAVMRIAPVNHGDGDDRMFMSTLITTAEKQGVSVYVGNGTNRWPAVHILDTATAYRLAVENSNFAPGSMFHVVAEEGVMVKEIAETIGKKLGVPVASKTLEEIRGLFGPFADILGVDNPVSNAKTKAVLGWVPKQCTLIADLQDGAYFSTTGHRALGIEDQN